MKRKLYPGLGVKRADDEAAAKQGPAQSGKEVAKHRPDLRRTICDNENRGAQILKEVYKIIR